MDNAHFDQFHKITVASVCLNIYRADHMPESSIAVVNENHNNFNKSSIEWLARLSKIEGIHLKYAAVVENIKEEVNVVLIDIMTLLKKYTSFMDVIGMVVQNVSKLRRNILKRGK